MRGFAGAMEKQMLKQITILAVIAVAGAFFFISGQDCIMASNKVQCWDKQFERELSAKGLEGAFNLMASLYDTHPVFARECHSFAHKLGTFAYDKYAKQEDITLTSKTHYCGYGFYHGFMEELLGKTNDPAKAREFCLYAGLQLRGQVSDAFGACYHGIGHGAVDGGDTRFWGDTRKMVEPGLELCRQVTGMTEISMLGDELYRCVSGAYNSLEILSRYPQYGLEELARDPFAFCRNQPKTYQEGCHTNMLPALMRSVSKDYMKAFRVIEDTLRYEEKTRYTTISSLAYELARDNMNEPDYITKIVDICRSLEDSSRLPCVDGLSGGHMQYGKPEAEYVKGLAFCGSDKLYEDERILCYEHILTRLHLKYTHEESISICASVPEEYRKGLCLVR
jgi:hypothetical protein